MKLITRKGRTSADSIFKHHSHNRSPEMPGHPHDSHNVTEEEYADGSVFLKEFFSLFHGEIWSARNQTVLSYFF